MTKIDRICVFSVGETAALSSVSDLVIFCLDVYYMYLVLMCITCIILSKILGNGLKQSGSDLYMFKRKVSFTVTTHTSVCLEEN